jgi:hypothetical protein
VNSRSADYVLRFVQNPLSSARTVGRSVLLNKALSQNARCKTQGFAPVTAISTYVIKTQRDADQRLMASSEKSARAKPSQSRGLQHFASRHAPPAVQNPSPEPRALALTTNA